MPPAMGIFPCLDIDSNTVWTYIGANHSVKVQDALSIGLLSVLPARFRN